MALNKTVPKKKKKKKKKKEKMKEEGKLVKSTNF